jgi:hypothetical protein
MTDAREKGLRLIGYDWSRIRRVVTESQVTPAAAVASCPGRLAW